MIIFSCHANPQGTNFSRFPHMFSPLSLREEESASGTAIFFSIHKSHTPSVFGEGTAKRICGFPRQPITTQASVPVTGNSCNRTPHFFLQKMKRDPPPGDQQKIAGGHKSRVVASRRVSGEVGSVAGAGGSRRRRAHIGHQQPADPRVNSDMCDVSHCTCPVPNCIFIPHSIPPSPSLLQWAMASSAYSVALKL